MTYSKPLGASEYIVYLQFDHPVFVDVKSEAQKKSTSVKMTSTKWHRHVQETS
jgi:hypothetical protein